MYRTKRLAAILLAAVLSLSLTPSFAQANDYSLITAETYTTQPGDWLYKIAERFGSTWQQLARQNPQIKNPHLIYPGQELDVKCYPTDYSNADNWLRVSQTADKQVDLFYVYPTVYTAEDTEPVFAEITSAKMRAGANRVASEHTALFEGACNVYVPYYRLMSLTSLGTATNGDDDDVLGGQPATDIIAAFDYFIKNYNNGRPFIIAGHSQGTMVLRYLLSDYMAEHPEVYERMVAAYMVGYSITDDYLNSNPHLKFAQGATDAGVIISYNTEMPGMTAEVPVVWPGARVINPLNWKTDSTYAPAELNLGSNKVDAQINPSRGVLECSTVDPNDPKYQLPSLFPIGSYHHCDYTFYGENLKQNALDRIAAFLGGKDTTDVTPAAVSPAAATDYADGNNWISRPEDMSKQADVFYLYPTAWQKQSPDEPIVCDIDNESMRMGAPGVFNTHKGAFEDDTNVFAPYYRQADAMGVLSLPFEEQGKIIEGIPKTDVFAAFDYYIKNLNNGRPFILAGHSQGSNMLLFLLNEYMRDNPDVYERMIAAYVIGYSVTEDYMAKNPHLEFAQGADDTGVIISWNTEAPGMDVQNPVVLPGSLAINPLSWTRTEEKAGAELNLGAIERTETGIIKVPGFADAQINLERGTVMCSTANPDDYFIGLALFPRGIYHGQDYDFYYYNLKQNVQDRIQAYMAGLNK